MATKKLTKKEEAERLKALSEEFIEGVDDINGVFLTIDKDGTEVMWAEKPSKARGTYKLKEAMYNDSLIVLPKGTIQKLLDKVPNYDHGPYYYEG